jgi:hypothetical protein
VVPTLGTDPTKSLKVKELGKNLPGNNNQFFEGFEILGINWFFFF